ncbi:hypothetical protein [Haloarcula litorea]|uniref:hypothetical protein n=1 Tax=Haloarcula litorea TaxID=3032579 RepID=UPI0023E8004F|nr:hypothetical protein [Halomicroarcula sp. GDY20]
MALDRSPRRTGLLVASLGVLTTAAHHFSVFLYPQYFIGTDAARAAYLDAWFSLVSTAGLGLRFVVIPLLAAVGGFYLVHVDTEPIRRVAGWFLVSGFVFGLGTLFLDWIVAEPSFQMSPGTALQYGILTMLSVALPALVAATIGHLSADGTRSLST